MLPKGLLLGVRIVGFRCDALGNSFRESDVLAEMMTENDKELQVVMDSVWPLNIWGICTQRSSVTAGTHQPMSTASSLLLNTTSRVLYKHLNSCEQNTRKLK